MHGGHGGPQTEHRKAMHMTPNLSSTLPAGNATVRVRLGLRRGPFGVPVLAPRVEVRSRQADILA